jgi:hypothetical protein
MGPSSPWRIRRGPEIPSGCSLPVWARPLRHLFTDEFDPLAPDASGDLVPQDLPVSANVIVGVNNGGVVVLAAKYAYGMVGVYEVDFQVPANTVSTNNAPFAILVYQNSNQLFWGNGSLLPIQ